MSHVVHLVANECGYTVLELSASHKRGSKELNSLLGEEVRSIFSRVKASRTLVLLDDVDVLHSDDRGFWNALSNMVSSAKCPIVLTFESRLI